MVPTASRPHPRPELRRRQAPALPSPRRLRRARLSPPPPGALPHSRPGHSRTPARHSRRLSPPPPRGHSRPALARAARHSRPALCFSLDRDPFLSTERAAQHHRGTPHSVFARSRSVPQHGTRGTAPPPPPRPRTARDLRSVAIRSSVRNAPHPRPHHRPRRDPFLNTERAAGAPAIATRRDPFLSTERDRRYFAHPLGVAPRRRARQPESTSHVATRRDPFLRTERAAGAPTTPARSVPQHRRRPTIFRAPAPVSHPGDTHGSRNRHPTSPARRDPFLSTERDRQDFAHPLGLAPRRHARRPESTSHVAAPSRSVPQHGTRPTRFRVRARCRVLAQFEIPAGWLSFRCRLYSTERNGRPRVA